MKVFLNVLGLAIAMNITCTGYSQTAPLGSVQGQGAMNSVPRGVMNEIKKPERAVIGNTYWDENWAPGDITFADGQVLANASLRYDIQEDMIELKIDNKLMGIRGKNVKSFTAYSGSKQAYEVYINASQYKEDEITKAGFFKVLAEGEWLLLEKMEVTYVKPNYNPVLGVGNEEPKYSKKTELFVAHGPDVFEVPNSKSKFLKEVNYPNEDLASFMKENDLSVKNTKDVKSIVEFLNTRS